MLRPFVLRSSLFPLNPLNYSTQPIYQKKGCVEKCLVSFFGLIDKGTPDYLTKELWILKASELLGRLVLLAYVFSLQSRTVVYHYNYEFSPCSSSFLSQGSQSPCSVLMVNTVPRRLVIRSCLMVPSTFPTFLNPFSNLSLTASNFSCELTQIFPLLYSPS